MNDQDNDRDHAWELTYADHSHQHKIIKYEQCKKCNAARVTEFPSGKLLGSEPEYIPPYCRVHPKFFVRSGKAQECKRVEVGLA